MAFTEAERVQIRKYLGFAAIYLQAQPLLENAITAVQSIAEGGSRPDSSTEDEIRRTLVKLQAVDTKLDELDCLGTVSVNKIVMDPIRARLAIAMQGRVLVGRLAYQLAINGPIHDVFSPGSVTPMDMPQLESGRRVY